MPENDSGFPYGTNSCAVCCSTQRADLFEPRTTTHRPESALPTIHFADVVELSVAKFDIDGGRGKFSPNEFGVQKNDLAGLEIRTLID